MSGSPISTPRAMPPWSMSRPRPRPSASPSPRGRDRHAAGDARADHGRRHEEGRCAGVARLAGIMGAKRTPDLIPLCHPLASDLGRGRADAAIRDATPVEITATCKLTGRTGVEMEALTAVAVAALTVYDMCKAVDRGMRIGDIRLLHKAGGKSGTYEARADDFGRRGAAARILAAFGRSRAEQVALADALGRVLAEDVVARGTQPPSPVSAMDGYAVRAADVASVPARLSVVGDGAGRQRLSAAGQGRRGGAHLHRRAGARRAPTPSSSRKIPSATAISSIVQRGRAAGRYVRPAGSRFQARANRSCQAGRRLTAARYRPRRGDEPALAARCAAGRASPSWRPATRSCMPGEPVGPQPDRQLQRAGARRPRHGLRRRARRSRHRARRSRRAAARWPPAPPAPICWSPPAAPRSATTTRRRRARRRTGIDAGFLEDRHAAGQAADVRPHRRDAGARPARQSGLDPGLRPALR